MAREARCSIAIRGVSISTDAPADGRKPIHNDDSMRPTRSPKTKGRSRITVIGNTDPLLARFGRCREALAFADELQMRSLIAHCHFSLGRLYRRTGQHQQAQEHLTTATTMFREMRLTYWREKAEAELQLLT
jgi:hypothetical protein